MATKNTKLVGDKPVSYWENPAKQIEWRVDINEKHISIPLEETDRAKENLMVQHFINNGFFIQTCIPSTKNKVFNPEIRLKLPAVKIPPPDGKYNAISRFN